MGQNGGKLQIVYQIRLKLTELFFGLALLTAPADVKKQLNRLRTVREVRL